MNKTITLDHLILLAYNDDGIKNPDKIVEALHENEEFLDEYIAIKEMQADLDRIQEEPAEQSIRNLINYAKSLNVFKSKDHNNTSLIIVN